MKRKLTYFILIIAFGLWVSIPEMTKANDVMVIEKSDLANALSEEIAVQAGKDAVFLENMRIKMSNDTRYYLLEKGLDTLLGELIEIKSIDLVGAERFKAHAVVHADESQHFTIHGQIQPAKEVPVASRALNRGDVLSEEDIDYRFVAERRLLRGTVMDEAVLLGKQLTRHMDQGKAFTMRSVMVPMAFKRGDVVTLSYHSGAISLTTIGEALEDAHIGEVVTLKNMDSGRIIRAMAGAGRQAEVNYKAKILQEAQAALHVKGGVRAN